MEERLLEARQLMIKNNLQSVMVDCDEYTKEVEDLALNLGLKCVSGYKSVQIEVILKK